MFGRVPEEPRPPNRPASPSNAAAAVDRLADFRTTRRVLRLVLLALPIGVLAAFVARGLIWLIAVITNLAFFQRIDSVPALPEHHALGAWVVLVPVVGAVLIGLLARYGSEKIRGHGIPEALESILLGKSLIDPRVAVLKPVSSALSIGTGGPFGAEGPIIMTGGAFGSLFAQLFHLSAAERKTLLVAGAAAGMAAVFATPIAATLLAVELLLFEWRPRSFIPVAVAAVVGALVRVPLLGSGPIVTVTPHAALGAVGIASALAVGVAAGFASSLATRLVYGVEDAFARLPVHWMWWPAIGGLAVGVGGWIDPRVLGIGFGSIEGLARGELVGATVAALLVAKVLVWTIALGSGTSGGVLAPLLIVGGALGALLGARLPGGDPGLFAMVGMAAMLGGTMRAPLTATVFLLELTHDVEALPALLVGSVAALCVTVLRMRRSILTEKLARRGQHIAREYTVDPLERTRVGEVMDVDAPLVHADETVGRLAERIANGEGALARRQAAFVVDGEGRLLAVATRDDLVRALANDPAGGARVLEAARGPRTVTYEDELLHDAVAKMLRDELGRLPVVDRAEPARIVGYLGRAEVLGARARLHAEEDERSRGPLATSASNVLATTRRLAVRG